MGWRGLPAGGTHTQKEVDPKKKTCFCYRKYVRDVKQDEKHVPDLLDAIMRPTCLVKVELRHFLFKLSQFRPTITKIRVCTFQVSGKIPDSSKTSPRAPLFATFGRASGQIFKKCGFLPARALTLVEILSCAKRHFCRRVEKLLESGKSAMSRFPQLTSPQSGLRMQGGVSESG